MPIQPPQSSSGREPQSFLQRAIDESAAAPKRPRYRWKLLRAGRLLLDGGSMFGVVPKALWGRNVQSDAQGRITLGHNCLLLEAVDAKSAGFRRAVIEVGSGDPLKYDEKFRQIFGLGDEWIMTALRDAGTSCEEIDHVIVTHLHFDHAGGLTRRARTGELADWISPAGLGIKLTFPKATLWADSREWDDAIANRSVMTRTYLREHLEPIRERLSFIESPPPFAPGHLPQRDELPTTPVIDRQTEFLPGLLAFNVPGHTWGQQAISFTDDRGQTVVFVPDLIPTAHHVGSAYNMAYDVEPFMSTVSRHWFLKEASAGNWVLVLDHEPGHAVFRARADGKGWYELVAEQMQ